jgi:hypothetical protein
MISSSLIKPVPALKHDIAIIAANMHSPDDAGCGGDLQARIPSGIANYYAITGHTA